MGGAIVLLFLMILFCVPVNAEQTDATPRTIKLTGTVSNDIKATVRTIFKRVGDETCKGTRAHRYSDWHHQDIRADEAGLFEIHIPLDYSSGYPECKYRFQSSLLIIEDNQKQYKVDSAEIFIAKYGQVYSIDKHANATATNNVGGNEPLASMPLTESRYFQIPNNSQIFCYQRQGGHRGSPDNYIACFPEYSSDNIGFKELKSSHIHLDMVMTTQAEVIAREQIERERREAEAGPPRKLTLYGQMDPRLYAQVRVWYSPAHYTDGWNNYDNPDCSFMQGDGRKRLKPTAAFIDIEPDEQGRYEVVAPIDYDGPMSCGHTFNWASVYVSRDKRDLGPINYASLQVLGKGRKPSHDLRGSYSGPVKGGGGMDNDKAHFQLSSGSTISCYTGFSEERGDASLTCEPLVASAINGVDEIRSTRLELNIEIDESRCVGFPSREGRKKGRKNYPDYFRDYQPPNTIWQKLKALFN